VDQTTDTVRYTINSWDTVPGNPVKSGSLVVIWSPADVFYRTQPANFVDSQTIRILAMPLSSGKTWQSLRYSRDSSFTVFTIPVLQHISMAGDAAVNGTVDLTFGGRSERCFRINQTTTSTVIALCDSTVRVPIRGDTLHKGDTLSMSTSRSDQEQYFSLNYTLGLRTSEREIKFDTNYYDTTSQRDTITRHTRIETIYDPRIDSLITR
jgi:hypothetical protein